MKLSTELSKWRCDRPDEWKMDEFIRNAEKLEAERDALAAQANRLHSSLRLLAHAVAKSGADLGDGLYLAAEALDATPEQCLSAHDAEVAENAVNDFCEWMLLSKRYSVAEWCGEYTKQLRAKAVK